MWEPKGKGERKAEMAKEKGLLVYGFHVRVKGVEKKGDADFEALISMCGYGRDAHEQDAFSSRITHRRSALQKQVTK